MINFHIANDRTYLDIEELKVLKESENDFILNKDDQKSIERYYESSCRFLDWYVTYSSRVLNGRVYKDRQISNYVFKFKFKSEKQYIIYILNCVYISKLYVEYIRTKITYKNIKKHHFVISHLVVDLESLIAKHEIFIVKSTKKLSLGSQRRKNLDPREIYFAAKTMFYIEEIEKIEDLYLRDLKPVVMFQLRQLLEMFGKNLIGYYSIEDTSGNPVKKFSQVAWEFIRIETKKESPRIVFPFDIEIILSINNWANDFVHSTFLHDSYLQFYALETVKLIFASKTKGILTYDGKMTRKFDCADIKIYNYNSIKLDFENYLRSKMSNIIVEWMDIKSVGGYIISE